MASITVNGNTIDPADAQFVSPDAKQSNFIIVQGYHDLSPTEKSQLTNLHVDIQEYVAQHTYLCRFEPENIQQIQTLSFVRAANVYNAQLKATVSLKDMVEREDDRTEYEVDLILHDNPNVSAATLAPFVAEASGVPVDQLEVLPNTIRLVVNQDKLSDLAALDSVNRIEEVRSKSIYNDLAREVLHADTVDISVGYRGSTETICVADTGFDQGEAFDTGDIKVHPAFAGRINHLRALWVEHGARDPVGHGTHVCGSICGSGNYVDSSSGQKFSIRGTAPSAKLMVQAMSYWNPLRKDWDLKAPADITELFSEPYAMGIRIHNNSWGDTWSSRDGQLGYEKEATAIDKYVREHLDFVVLVAAGNDAQKPNHGTSQIGDNGAAKNCITVGATGSNRPNDGQSFDTESSASSGIADTAIFSSRGPTKATINAQGQPIIGRIKPDVVAPGVAILSAASRALKANHRARERYGTTQDQDWLYMSGTSMAAPLVAGCVALIREALQEIGKKRPSAALVKALLVNAAVNCTEKTGRGFDYEQGFGRVDVNSAIAMLKQTKYGGFVDGGSNLESSSYDVPGILQSGQWESQAIPVPDGQNTFIATLVYSDGQGALLQNDINLIVRAGNMEMHGNMGNDPGLDHTNNVERVVWPNVPGSTVTVIVKPYAFLNPLAEQSFAVVWSFRGLN